MEQLWDLSLLNTSTWEIKSIQGKASLYTKYFIQIMAFDLSGTYPEGPHRYLTELSFWMALQEFETQSQCSFRDSYGDPSQILKALVYWNLEQDRNEFRWNDARHYTRKPVERSKSKEEFYQKELENRHLYNKAYGDYLQSELNSFYRSSTPAKATKENGLDALRSLGHLLHSWQDFYAHAMPKDVFSRYGLDNVHPEQRSHVHPASWQWWSLTTEHPGWGIEPIPVISSEGILRKIGAIEFCKRKLLYLLFGRWIHVYHHFNWEQLLKKHF